MQKKLRFKLLFLAATAAALLASRFDGNKLESALPNEDYRAPLRNPVLEPDRPDLLEEPRIDEP